MKLNLIFTSVALLMVISFNSHAQDVSVTGESIHLNIHQIGNASSAYQQWSENKSNQQDPFSRIGMGYNTEQKNLKETYVANEYRPYVDMLANEGAEISSRTVQDRVNYRNDEIKRIYQLALHSESGKLDSATFRSEYAQYQEEKSQQAVAYYEEFQALVARAGIERNRENHQQNLVIGEKSHTATANLLSLMKQRRYDTKQAISASFEDNVANAQASNSFAEDALVKATNFSGDCPACQLPIPVISVVDTPTPPVDEEEEPSYTAPNWECDQDNPRTLHDWEDKSIFYICD